MSEINIFVTGTHTDIGKTVVAAIIAQATQATYFKPVQSGARTDSDKRTISELTTGVNLADECYLLQEPLSPHAAAEIDGVKIELHDILRPKSNQPLVIEGAGGLLVPLNDNNTIADLIDEKDKVVLVSKHYLGSINHTLLSIEYAKQKGWDVAVVFVGNENKETEQAIAHFGGVSIIGRIPLAEKVTRLFVQEQAQFIKHKLIHWLTK